MRGRRMRVGVMVVALALGRATAGAEDAGLVIGDGTRVRDLLSKKLIQDGAGTRS